MDPFSFHLQHVDANSAARLSRFNTPHGPLQMPAFMPVGTQGTVKGLTAEQVAATGAQMVLSNTYHLTLRPGESVIHRLGGLHSFMRWDGPILTDSGGFQIFSLSRLTKVTDEGASFRSHIDGQLLHLTPEKAVQIQEALGSDVAMVLDDVVALPNSRERIVEACQRSLTWARRCRDVASRDDQALFAIVQGGLDEKLRIAHAESLTAMDFAGYAIGGLSVGEAAEDMYRILNATCPVLPQSRPRYLMGVGTPRDLLEAVLRGVDLFDCVMPTRNGRNSMAFTDSGTIRLRNQCHHDSTEPLEQDCPCIACKHSRGYLRHLFVSGEMLGPILLSIHNLTYYQRLLSRAREAILQDRFVEFYHQRISQWQSDPVTS